MQKVLVVDDSPGTRETAAAVLRLAGHEVLVAASGLAAVKLAHADVGVALIDLHLPDISGLDVAKRLRIRGFGGRIIIVTAFPDWESSFAAGSSGVNAYVEGPLWGDQLEAIVEEASTSTSEISRISPISKRSPDRRIQQAMRLVEQEPHRAWTAELLAEHVKLSVSRLRHQFTRVTSVSLSRYIRLRRVEHFRRLLSFNSESIQLLGQRAGLGSDTRRIRRLFRDRFGLSPNEYRERFGRAHRAKPAANVTTHDDR